MPDAPLPGLAAIADDYDAILCDVWGVVHNGVAAYEGAADALSRFRAMGKTVILMTNAPRPAPPIVEQLRALGVPETAFDEVVSSGEVVRRHLKDAGYRHAHHIGPERDHSLFESVGLPFSDDPDRADVIVATDLRDNDDSPEDYREELAALVGHPAPFVCANPDIIVERGGRLIYCGGSLARVFEEAGGTALQFGKPHKPIYDLSRERVQAINPGAARLLAIGDGLPTDIAGANAHGLDVLFVTNGIHTMELGEPGRPDPEKVRERLVEEGLRATHYMPMLAW